MRFLADENFPRAVVAALEQAGHDVVWVRLAAPGSTDAAVAARSLLPSGRGVLLFRVPAPRSQPAAQSLAARIAARDDWAGQFSVVEPGRIRMRRLH